MDGLHKCLMNDFELDVALMPDNHSETDCMILTAKRDHIDICLDKDIAFVADLYHDKMEWLINLAIKNKRFGDTFIEYISKHVPETIVSTIQHIYDMKKEKALINAALSNKLNYNNYSFEQNLSIINDNVFIESLNDGELIYLNNLLT